MIGIDLVHVPEFQRQLDAGGPHFLGKMFNQSELGNRSIEHLAGLWAAKEAVMKAAPEPPLRMTDIVIMNDPSGRPHAIVAAHSFDVSISHHGDYVVAVALGVER
jgi:phosphopantetheine--protein transferase-like protein